MAGRELFRRLKCEWEVDVFDTSDQLRTLVFEYLEGFFNHERLHSSLGCGSPDEFERMYHQTRR